MTKVRMAKGLTGLFVESQGQRSRFYAVKQKQKSDCFYRTD